MKTKAVKTKESPIKEFKVKEKDLIQNINLLDISKKCMWRYGAATIEDRALVDFRDGLKPVHRYVTWAAHTLGLNCKAPPTKSARIVGEVIAKLSPHGDKGTYDAMVTLANLPKEIIDGSSSNFGGLTASAASYRYTNCRLSKYGDNVFFNPDYIKVVDLVPNFDGKEVEPLILPSLLPNALVNGAFGIAVGVTAHLPCFTPQSLAVVVQRLLKKEEVTDKDLYKTLKFGYRYGGKVYTADADYRNDLIRFFKTGFGSATFESEYRWDAKKKTMQFYSFAPNLNIEKAIEKSLSLDCVSSVENLTSKANGYLYQVTLKKNNDEDAIAEVNEVWCSTLHYKCNVTERYLDENGDVEVKFRSTTPLQLLKDWVKWRVELETKCLTNQLKLQDAAIDYTNLLLLAQKNRALIAKSWEADDQDKFVMKALKINAEQTKTVLSLNVRQLGKLDREALLKKLKDQQNHAAQIKVWLKSPAKKVSTDLADLMTRI